MLMSVSSATAKIVLLNSKINTKNEHIFLANVLNLSEGSNELSYGFSISILIFS
jgi:hypothetical protein